MKFYCMYMPTAKMLPRLIGRKGIMASSIRQMMSIAARDVHKRISVKFEAY